MRKVNLNDFEKFTSISAVKYDEASNCIGYVTSSFTNKHIRPVNTAYVKSLDTGKTRQITANGYNESSINFLKDNTYLILSNSDNADYNKYQQMRHIRQYYIQNQLYKVSGKKIEKLTDFLHGVESYVLSPSKRKALLTVKYYEADDKENLNHRFSKKQLNKIKEELACSPIIVKNKSFKSDGDLGYKEEAKRALYLLDLEDNSLKYLDYTRYIGLCFDKEDNIYYYHFSEKGLLNIYKNNELFISCDNVKPHPGSSIIFNKDYSKLLLAVQTTENGFNEPVVLVCLENKMQKDITAKFVFDIDDKLEDGIESDCGNFSMVYGNGCTYCFTDDDQIIYSRGISGNINLLKNNNEPIITNEHCFKGLVRKSANEIFALHTTSDTPTEIVVINTETATMETIVKSNEYLNDCHFSKAISFDGNIHGWVMKPIDFKENTKYPTLLVVHGGPNSFYSSGFSLEMQHYCANGFAVIFSNPVGSCGYGKNHSDMSKSFDDTAMNQLIDYCKRVAEKFDFVDVDRIGITGGSYGGFETIYACGHSDFFKVGAALRPLGNFLMIANCSHSAGNENSLENFKDDYTKYIADYVVQSPNSYADKIKVPFLMVAHEKDANCIPAQMIQLFKLLKTIHPELPTRLILTPDSNHGLNGIGPIKLSLAVRDEVVNWFKKYL